MFEQIRRCCCTAIYTGALYEATFSSSMIAVQKSVNIVSYKVYNMFLNKDALINLNREMFSELEPY